MKRTFLLVLLIIIITISITTLVVYKKYSSEHKTLNQNELSEKDSYYGVWTIKKIITYAKVSAITDAEIGKLINKNIMYSDKEISIENKILENPYYKKSEISNDEFFHSGYLNLEDIGINTEYADQIEVYSQETDDNAFYWYEFGGTFYIKDKETIIVQFKGAFFELKRD